jgi:hypothetical protein
VVRFPASAKESSAERPNRLRSQPSLLFNVRPAFSPGIRRRERESDHSSVSSAEVKN